MHVHDRTTAEAEVCCDSIVQYAGRRVQLLSPTLSLAWCACSLKSITGPVMEDAVSAVFMMWSAGGQQQSEPREAWISALYLKCFAHSLGLRMSGRCLKACRIGHNSHSSRCKLHMHWHTRPSMALSVHKPLRYDAVALTGALGQPTWEPGGLGGSLLVQQCIEV
jgi:hypothetical protein